MLQYIESRRCQWKDCSSDRNANADYIDKRFYLRTKHKSFRCRGKKSSALRERPFQKEGQHTGLVDSEYDILKMSELLRKKSKEKKRSVR